MSAFKEKSFKTLKCNDCGEPVEKVDNKATGVALCLFALAQSFNLPQMLIGQIAQNRCYA